MQRLAGLVIVLALVAVPMVAAQGDELPRVFSGNTLTVRYPDGWGFNVAQDETVTLTSNPEFLEDGALTVHEGEVAIQIFTMPERWPRDDIKLHASYMAGNFMVRYILTVGWLSDEKPELDTITVSEYTIGERVVYEVWLVTKGPDPADLRFIGIEGPILVAVTTPRGEMDQHSDTINAILAAVELVK